VAHLRHLHGGRGAAVSADLRRNVWVIAMDLLMLGGYLWLALMAAREQPGS
jgi:hypothetical protein